MSDDFPAFALSEEHEALRESVRTLADDKIALRTLDHTRITIAAQALGIAQGALDYALGYVRERKQFGRAVAEFQGLQFMIADMAMKLCFTSRARRKPRTRGNGAARSTRR